MVGEKLKSDEPVSVNDEEGAQDVKKEEEEAEEKKTATLSNQIVFGLLITAAVFYILNVILRFTSGDFISINSILVYIASILGILFTIRAVLNERILSTIESMRELTFKLKEQADDLGEQNKTLTNSVDKTEQEIAKLNKNETELNDICKQQGTNISDMVSITKENSKILESMERILEMRAVQDLTRIILVSDTDGNDTIEGHELEILTLRLSAVEAIELNEEIFKKRVQYHGGDLGAVFLIINKMCEVTEDDDPDNEVFHIQKERLQGKMTSQLF